MSTRIKTQSILGLKHKQPHTKEEQQRQQKRQEQKEEFIFQIAQY